MEVKDQAPEAGTLTPAQATLLGRPSGHTVFYRTQATMFMIRA